MEVLFNFAVKILVIYLFVAIYSSVYFKKLFPGYIPFGKALVCILTGFVVSRTILNLQLPYATRTGFFIFALVTFYSATILSYRFMEKKKRKRNSNL